MLSPVYAPTEDLQLQLQASFAWGYQIEFEST